MDCIASGEDRETTEEAIVKWFFEEVIGSLDKAEAEIREKCGWKGKDHIADVGK